MALVVLTGRFTGHTSWVRILHDAPPMAFTTACAFLGTGCTLLLNAAKKSRLAAVTALLPGLLALGTLSVYVLASPLGWQTFIYNSEKPIMAAGVGIDGRMAPNAAISFILLSTALFLWARGVWRPRLTATLAATVMGIAGVSLASYATGLRTSAAWWRYTAMALHTAVSFEIIGGMLVFWVIRKTPATDRPAIRTFPFIALACSLIGLLAIVTSVSNDQQQITANQVRRAVEMKAGIERFIAANARADTAVRGFLLTGSSYQLGRIETHRKAVFAAIDDLERLNPKNEAIAVAAARLRETVTHNFQTKDGWLATRQQRGVDAAVAALEAEPGEVGRTLREITEGITASADVLLAASESNLAQREREVRWALIIGAVLVIATLAIAFAMANSAREQLSDANRVLETRVAERTRDLKFLFDAMPQLVFTAFPDGTFESLNKRWLDYLGVTSEAQGREVILNAIHPEDSPKALAEWERVRREEKPGGGENRLKNASGIYRWHLWRAYPQRDETGKLVRWVGTSTDIDEQKNAAALLERRVAERTAELLASRERLQSIADSLPLFIAYLDHDIRYRFTNQTYKAWLGLDPEAILGCTAREILGEDDYVLVAPAIEKVLRGERSGFERAIKTVNGERIIKTQYVPEFDAHGKVGGFYLVGIDITDEKAIEQNLAKARDAAVAASRLKSEFLATISHEIRTPMNGIIGMATLLKDMPLGDEQKDMVQVIEQSADSLLSIINDILDISKMEAGKFTIESRDFDFRELIRATVATFATRAEEKGLALTQDCDPRLARPVRGDSGRIRQILTNLTGNAIKFTDRGSVKLSVTTTATDDHTAGLRITVRDTGAGISPDDQEKLFAPFVQVDASSKKRFGGTGLGLAISRQLVELMNGKIGVESESGQGSEFWFTLTLPWAREAPPSGETAATHPFRILVIDDDKNDRELAAYFLSGTGIEIETVESAESGLEKLRAAAAGKTHYDLVLVDQKMPAMSGLEFGQAVRADPLLGETPLVLVSGGELQEADEAGKVGFEAFLNKPVRAEAVTAIRRQLAFRITPARPANSQSSSPKKVVHRILVVDDNEANRSVARLTLARFGQDVEVAASGAEALEKLSQKEFDLVFMDCQMPDLNGYETTRLIRGGSREKIDARIPIIALTAYAMSGDAEKCLGAGMNDYISKPLRVADIRAALKRCGLALPLATNPAWESSPLPVSANPIADYQHISEMQALPGQDGKSLWGDLLDSFREKSHERIGQMENFNRQENFPALAELVHRFAGSCATVGAIELKELALQIEHFAETRNQARLVGCLKDLNAALTRFLDLMYRRSRPEDSP